MAGGSKHLKTSTRLSAIYGELNRLESANRLSSDRGWLLAVLHTTRTMDTTLSELLAAKGWKGPQSHSLGSYLHDLATNNALNAGERNHYQSVVVKKRNKYMHEAGAMPQKKEADLILSEMQTCLYLVFSRI